MLRLVLDENISPAISSKLWDEGIDNYPVRDRGELGIPDHRLFELAMSEDRIVATINTADFERLAKSVETHPGVICIPAGGTRDMQFAYIMRAVEFARSANAILPALTDRS